MEVVIEEPHSLPGGLIKKLSSQITLKKPRAPEISETIWGREVTGAVNAEQSREYRSQDSAPGSVWAL